MAYALLGVGVSRAAACALLPPRWAAPPSVRRRPWPAALAWGGRSPWAPCSSPVGAAGLPRGGMVAFPRARPPCPSVPVAVLAPARSLGPGGVLRPPSLPPLAPLGVVCGGGGVGGGAPLARPPGPVAVLLASAPPSLAGGWGGGRPRSRAPAPRSVGGVPSPPWGCAPSLCCPARPSSRGGGWGC